MSLTVALAKASNSTVLRSLKDHIVEPTTIGNPKVVEHNSAHLAIASGDDAYCVGRADIEQDVREESWFLVG